MHKTGVKCARVSASGACAVRAGRLWCLHPRSPKPAWRIHAISMDKQPVCRRRPRLGRNPGHTVLEVREGLLAKAESARQRALRHDRGEGEHGRAAVGQLGEVVLLLIALEKLERVEAEVARRAVGLALDHVVDPM